MLSNANLRGLFVSGIDTGVGKTVASAVLRQALGAAYWKPVQAGDLDQSDSLQVARWTPSVNRPIHPERFRLNHPMSPHAAAARDGISIQLPDFRLPDGNDFLVVEGAGGLLVPLNGQNTILDLMQQLGLPIVLVSKHYLGSINHTLLSLEAIRRRQLVLKALVFNGREDPETEDVILGHAEPELVLRLPPWPEVDPHRVKHLAATWATALGGLASTRKG